MNHEETQSNILYPITSISNRILTDSLGRYKMLLKEMILWKSLKKPLVYLLKKVKTNYKPKSSDELTIEMQRTEIEKFEERIGDL